jgi:sugar phosphate isomerase/epimerase
MLDFKHANLDNCLPAFLETDFSHMHLHDNNGRKDAHISVGEGNIDSLPLIAALQRIGATAILEVKDFEGVLRSITKQVADC